MARSGRSRPRNHIAARVSGSEARDGATESSAPPFPREVAVQVDVRCVVARPGGPAVGVQMRHDREVHVGGRVDPAEPLGEPIHGTLVTVCATDDRDVTTWASRLGIPADDRPTFDTPADLSFGPARTPMRRSPQPIGSSRRPRRADSPEHPARRYSRPLRAHRPQWRRAGLRGDSSDPFPRRNATTRQRAGRGAERNFDTAAAAPPVRVRAGAAATLALRSGSDPLRNGRSNWIVLGRLSPPASRRRVHTRRARS